MTYFEYVAQEVDFSDFIIPFADIVSEDEYELVSRTYREHIIRSNEWLRRWKKN